MEHKRCCTENTARLYLTSRRFNTFAVKSALQSGHGKRHVYFAAYSARLTGQRRTALKDFWQLIATSLKRRAILNRYRRVVKRQRADEAKISSPHIRHFGLKAKSRFAPDM
jgi:hypothetical protein